MKFEDTEVWGFEHAIRGMRSPLESWDKSDSLFCCNKTTDEDCKKCPLYNDEKQCRRTIRFQQETNMPFYIIGKNDLDLMHKLIKAGTEHRKFLRQIFISVDITAPLYWWKEFDTYKVGTVANSCSTMHKLKDTPITMDCFEMDDFADSNEESNHYNLYTKNMWLKLIDHLEALRKEFNETKDKRYWKELIRLLPESWLQKRTVTMSYENVANMYSQRMNHKLTEWSKDFIQWADNLPYFKELFTV